MHEVRPARLEDARGLADMLARAFASDPVSCYLFPDPSQRAVSLRRFFGVQLRQNYLARGEVWVEQGLRGAALWMPPSPAPPGLSELAVHLGLVTVFRQRLGVARRLARLLAARHPRASHYYLGTLGTEPACQRRGIASALLAPVLSRCDATGIPVYLESSRKENVRFYEARGFGVVETVEVPGGPCLWLMWRVPVAGSQAAAGAPG